MGRPIIQDEFVELPTSTARYRARLKKRTGLSHSEFYRRKNPERSLKEKEKAKKERADLRCKVFEKYGRKCSCCGFSDERALQIDHVNGDGSQERRELCEREFLEKVLVDVEGNYQLLCANCNWIKRLENG